MTDPRQAMPPPKIDPKDMQNMGAISNPGFLQGIVGRGVLAKPKRPKLTRLDHWRLFRRDVRLAWQHLRKAARWS
jgi:hypothetical protein